MCRGIDSDHEIYQHRGRDKPPLRGLPCRRDWSVCCRQLWWCAFGAERQPQGGHRRPVESCCAGGRDCGVRCRRVRCSCLSGPCLCSLRTPEQRARLLLYYWRKIVLSGRIGKSCLVSRGKAGWAAAMPCFSGERQLMRLASEKFEIKIAAGSSGSVCRYCAGLRRLCRGAAWLGSGVVAVGRGAVVCRRHHRHCNHRNRGRGRFGTAHRGAAEPCRQPRGDRADWQWHGGSGNRLQPHRHRRRSGAGGPARHRGKFDEHAAGGSRLRRVASAVAPPHRRSHRSGRSIPESPDQQLPGGFHKQRDGGLAPGAGFDHT